MSKRIFTVLFLCAVMVMGSTAAASADGGIKVIVDGKTVNGECVVVDGRTLAPVRAITEAMGASVSWDSAAKKVTITKFITNEGNREVLLWIGRNQASINGMFLVDLDVPAQIINGNTMIPVRALAEDLFEGQVDWDSAAKVVTISSTRSLTSQGQAAAENQVIGNQLQQMTDDVNKKLEEQYAQNRADGLLEGYGYYVNHIGVRKSEGSRSYVMVQISGTPYKEEYADLNLSLNILDKQNNELLQSVDFKLSDLSGNQIFLYDIPSQYIDKSKYNYEVRVKSK